jgi:hypothetical protein
LFPKDTPTKDKNPSQLRKIAGKISFKWLETSKHSYQSNGNLNNSLILYMLDGNLNIGEIVKMESKIIYVKRFTKFVKYVVEGKKIYKILKKLKDMDEIRDYQIHSLFSSTKVEKNTVIFTKD